MKKLPDCFNPRSIPANGAECLMAGAPALILNSVIRATQDVEILRRLLH